MWLPQPYNQATAAYGQANNAAATTMLPPHCNQPTNAAAQLQPTAISTSARATTSFYRRIQHYITGRNKRSFSGPHKLYGVDCLAERHIHTCIVWNMGFCVSLCVSFMCRPFLLILYIWYFSSVFKCRPFFPVVTTSITSVIVPYVHSEVGLC
jgi:hypothetical protein